MATTDNYYGLPTGRLQNEHIAVAYLTTAGPRLVGLYLDRSPENLFAETPDSGWETGQGFFRLYGGHRLWYAPEFSGRTDWPDNGPVQIEEIARGTVRLTGETEPLTGLEKSVEIDIANGAPCVSLTHRLRNRGVQTHDVALWAITQIPLGGIAILPQSNAPRQGQPLGPNRHLALWPCSRWTDPRLILNDEMLLVQARAGLPPYKVGCLSREGWIGYLMGTRLWEFRFQPQPGLPHADSNCNAEIFVNDAYIEIEVLSPLAGIEPGAEATLIEQWTWRENVGTPRDALALIRLLQS